MPRLTKGLTELKLKKTEYYEIVDSVEWELWRGRDGQNRETLCWIPAWVPAQLFEDALKAFPEGRFGQAPAEPVYPVPRVLRANRRPRRGAPTARA